MKIQISENIDKAIEGYIVIPILYGEVDLSRIPNNCASNIIAIDAVDSIKRENIEKFIQDVCSKMRLGSVLNIGGLDIYAVSRDFLGGKIDLDEYNKLMANKRGIHSNSQITQLLSKYAISIQSVVFKGYYYEIAATRPQNIN